MVGEELLTPSGHDYRGKGLVMVLTEGFFAQTFSDHLRLRLKSSFYTMNKGVNIIKTYNRG